MRISDWSSDVCSSDLLLGKLATAQTALLGGDPLHGQAAALKQLWSLTMREAQTLSYGDAFTVILVCFVIATVMVPLMRKVGAPSPAAAAEAHIGRASGRGRGFQYLSNPGGRQAI